MVEIMMLNKKQHDSKAEFHLLSLRVPAAENQPTKSIHILGGGTCGS